MSRLSTLLVAIAIIIAGAVASNASVARAADQEIAPPRVFLMDARALVAARQDARSGAPALAPALAELRRDADRAARAEAYSVVNKTRTPPSGDRHDYTSLSIYWWPNPDAPGGLPYVLHDGERNPESDDTTLYDERTLSRMVNAVDALALAYYLTRTAAYADHAARFVRTWFLDEATRMNPNMRYAEMRPGIVAERGIGIIQSRAFMRVADAVGLLADSPAWTAADQETLQAWFADLLRWLRESPQGQMESWEPNNHGSWYDAQVADFALFAGQDAAAAQVVAESAERRIALQIEPDGRQPYELARTRSLSYSAFNLQALFQLATLGDRVGVDLWSYQTPDGRGIRRALDLLLPSVGGAAPWPYPQITSFNHFVELAPVLRRAATVYPDGSYGQALAELSRSQRALPLLKLQVGAWKLE